MFIAKRQSRWPVFVPGHKPLRTKVSGDTLINFFAQRPICQSSLTMPVRLIDSSMRGGQGKSQQSEGKKERKEKANKAHIKGLYKPGTHIIVRSKGSSERRGR